MSRRTRVPWVRTRVAHLPGIAAAVTLLTLLTAFLAAALPLQLDRYQDRALGSQLRHAGLDSRSIRIASAGHSGLASSQLWQLASDQALGQAQAQLRAEVQAPLSVDRAAEVAGIRTTAVGGTVPLSGMPLTGSGAATLGEQPARIDLVWQPDPHRELRFVQGRMPADPQRTSGPDGRFSGITGPVEFAVSTGAAAKLRLRVGAVYQLGDSFRARLSGIYRVADPQADWWLTSTHLTDAAVESFARPKADPISYWYTDAITSAGTASVMNLVAAGNAEVYWYFPLRTDALKAHQVDAAEAELVSFTDGDKATEVASLTIPPGDLTASSGLGRLLQDWSAQRDALAPLVAVGASGTAGVGAVVLLMGLGIAADRRREELQLLRGRGASLRTLGLRLLAESALYAGAGALLGAGAAVLLLPTSRHLTALAAALALWLLTALAYPVRLLAGHRRVRPRGRGEELVRAR
ncbi:hypothetical protein ACFP3V_00805, partial [Streptacidiphilus monticola]